MTDEKNTPKTPLVSIRTPSQAPRKCDTWTDPDDISNPVPRVETVKVAPETKANSTKSVNVLDNAIGRRCDDLFKSRRDLAGRVTEALAIVRTEKNYLQDRFDKADETEKQLTGILDSIMPDIENEVLPSTQSELSDACRKVEKMRLETIAAAKAFECSAKTANGNAAQREPVIDIDSLTFGQLIRMAFIFALPLGACIIISALILAAAYILALRGGF